MPNDGGQLLDFMKEIGEAAGRVLNDFRGSTFTVKRKGDDTYVTDADLASEKLILDRIRARFPDDKIYSEEAGLSSPDRTPGSAIWIIDPLDGTTNFANRYDFFCVSIARGRFAKAGPIAIEHACIHDPVRNKTYLAAKGAGARVNGRPLKVNATADLKDAFLVTGFFSNTGVDLKKDIMRLYEVAIRCNGIRRDGSAALDMALVAEGIYDGFWEWGLRPWDVGAGMLLIEEAGGSVLNYPGEPLLPFDVEKAGLICGALPIVKALSELIQTV